MHLQINAEGLSYIAKGGQVKSAGSGVPKDCDARHQRHRLLEYFEPFRVELRREDADSSHLAARMSQTRRLSFPDQIIGAGDDRYGRGLRPERPNRNVADGNHRVGFAGCEIGGQSRNTFDMTLGVAPLNENVAALLDSHVVESLRHSIAGISCGIGFEDADFWQLGCILLRARCERPCRCRAAEQRDDGAAIHSMTSSARSRNDSGIAKPSALAVVRFTTRSNLVGCSTGMSAGFAPRRILST